METIDWNQKIKEALDRTQIMAISTIGEDGSWTNPVQYYYSEKFELYFVSKMSTKHVQNILKDNRISVAIFNPERFPGGGVLGLQLKGTVKHLTDQAEIDEANRVRGKQPSGEWNIFKITPTELWCFDSRIFGEERRPVDMDSLNIPLWQK
jgi:uncharacterized protein YhbP (UPF0306 family)